MIKEPKKYHFGSDMIVKINESIERLTLSANEGNAPEVMALILAYSKAIAQIKKNIEEMALSQVEREGTQWLKVNNGRASLVYEDDPKYRALKEQLDHRKKQIKEATNGLDVADEDGEAVPSVSKKYGKDYLTLNLK